MVSSSILTAVLVIPVSDPAALAEITNVKPGEPVAIRFTTQTQRAEFRENTRQLLGAARRTAIPDPFEVSPPLLGLYRQLPHVSGLPKTELRRLREAAAQRLIDMHGVLSRRESARKREESKSSEKSSSVNERLQQPVASDEPATPAALNGTEFENAAALISLIENVVEPDSWQSRGGNGRAMYIGGRIKALVIRQTQEVHEQIGGTLKAIRRAQ